VPHADLGERRALDQARLSLGIRGSVDLVRSTVDGAPAVMRIIRPVIVLPDSACDDLDDEELESLLRHECAHVARRDNAFGVIESMVVAAFWFHPLVWVAQRALATAREEACDEMAVATPAALKTYVSALSKICRSILVPRLAGASCMASAHLKERLSHIMNYESLRARALSHQFVLAFAMIAVLGITIGSGLGAAPVSDSQDTPFKLELSVRPGNLADILEFEGRVIDASSGLPLTNLHLRFKRGSAARFHTVAEGRDLRIEIRDHGASVSAVMRVSKDGVQEQESTYSAVPQSEGTARPRRFSPHQTAVDRGANGASRHYSGRLSRTSSW